MHLTLMTLRYPIKVKDFHSGDFFILKFALPEYFEISVHDMAGMTGNVGKSV